LLDDLLAEGELERAIELLGRLVAANPRDPDYALHLAEAHAAMGDNRLAARLWRHAAPLLAGEGRRDEARTVLQQLTAVTDDPAEVQVALRRLEAGESIEWTAVQQAIQAGARKELAERLGSGTHQRTKAGTGSGTRREAARTLSGEHRAAPPPG
jgi:thioredoxin-like negative regulator of GroEL